MFKKISEHPIGSGMILLVMGSSTALAFFTKFFSWLWQQIVFAYEWSISPSLLPNWSFVLLCLLLTPSVLIFIAYLRDRKESNPAYLSYQQDTFFNIKWRWRYFNNSATEVFSFCPYCDYQIAGQNYQTYGKSGLEDRVRFSCENCNTALGDISGTGREVNKRALLTVQQRIRTGEWEKIVQTPSSSC